MVKAAAAMELKTHKRNRALKPIHNTKAQRLSYSKRKDCIMRKTMELGILCGTDACTIILGPNAEVETWPENPSHVKTIIGKYRAHGKMKGVQLQPEKTGEKTNPNVCLLGCNDDWISGLSIGELWTLLGDLDLKLEAVRNRVGFLNLLSSNEHGNGLDFFPVNYCHVEKPIQQFVNGYSCFPLNAQPLSLYGVSDHHWIPMGDTDDRLQPFCMDQNLLGSGNEKPMEPVAMPSFDISVFFDGDSYQNWGNYANDDIQNLIARDELVGTPYGKLLVNLDGDSYQDVGNYGNDDNTKKLITSDDSYAGISPLAEVVWGMRCDDNPMECMGERGPCWDLGPAWVLVPAVFDSFFRARVSA